MYVQAVRTASSSHQSSKTAERVTKEIQSLKGEIASLSRLKFHADAKCAEMADNNKAIKEGKWNQIQDPRIFCTNVILFEIN